MSTILNFKPYLKPYRHEAIQRVRINGLCLIFLAAITYLLPIPTFLSALRMVMSKRHSHQWEADWFYRNACILEVSIAALLCFNIALGILAIKYPRPPLPPTPAKKGVQMTPQSSKRSFGRLNMPNRTTPLSGAKSLPTPGATSQSPVVPVSYPNSPLATPSRVKHYSMPMSSSTTTLASSTSSLPPSPSPIVAAYRGKHLGESFGRAVDGTFLSRLAREKAADEDD